jgi:hypothetical protein
MIYVLNYSRWSLSPISVMNDIGLCLISEPPISDSRQLVSDITVHMSDIRLKLLSIHIQIFDFPCSCLCHVHACIRAMSMFVPYLCPHHVRAHVSCTSMFVSESVSVFTSVSVCTYPYPCPCPCLCPFPCLFMFTPHENEY